MSGSWDQSSRKLIGELKETLRQHFKKVQTFALPVDISAAIIDYRLETPVDIYGGSLFTQLLESRHVSLTLAPVCHLLKTEFQATVHIDQTSFTKPFTNHMPLLETHLFKVPVMPPSWHDVFEWPVESFPLPSSIKMAPARLVLTKNIKAQPLLCKRIEKPRTAGIKSLKGAKAKQYMVSSNSLPIQRRPIPAHRFSPAHRKQFRERLAQKAQLPLIDIKLVHIFDRVFLTLYQSISQAQDGSLLCIPKLSGQMTSTSSAQTPYYLIIGSSLKNPEQSIQVVLPMDELNNDT